MMCGRIFLRRSKKWAEKNQPSLFLGLLVRGGEGYEMTLLLRTKVNGANPDARRDCHSSRAYYDI